MRQSSRLRRFTLLFFFSLIILGPGSAEARCGGFRLGNRRLGNFDDFGGNQVVIQDGNGQDGNGFFQDGNGQVFINNGLGGLGLNQGVFDPGNLGPGNLRLGGFNNGFFNGGFNGFDPGRLSLSGRFGRSLRNGVGPGVELIDQQGRLIRVASDQAGNLIDSFGRRFLVPRDENGFPLDRFGNILRVVTDENGLPRLVGTDRAGNILRRCSRDGFAIRPVLTGVPDFGDGALADNNGFNQNDQEIQLFRAPASESGVRSFRRGGLGRQVTVPVHGNLLDADEQ